MQRVNNQVQSKEICDVLEVKAVLLGITGMSLVAGGATRGTAVGGAQGCAVPVTAASNI